MIFSVSSCIALRLRALCASAVTTCVGAASTIASHKAPLLKQDGLTAEARRAQSARSGIPGIFRAPPGISMAVARSRFAIPWTRRDLHISHCHAKLFGDRGGPEHAIRHQDRYKLAPLGPSADRRRFPGLADFPPSFDCHRTRARTGADARRHRKVSWAAYARSAIDARFPKAGAAATPYRRHARARTSRGMALFTARRSACRLPFGQLLITFQQAVGVPPML